MAKNASRVVTFGEIMLRLSPLSPVQRLLGAEHFLVEPGGAEANVAVTLAQLGERCSFVTALPHGVLGEKVLRYLRANNVGTDAVIFAPGRLGLYWTENGCGPRPSEVFYDRAHSVFSERSLADFPWSNALAGAGWLHVSGITPGISRRSAGLISALTGRLPRQLKVSVDLNYRSKLWQWCPSSARRRSLMWNICSGAALICANETDLSDALGLGGAAKDKEFDYDRAARECFRRLPRLRYLGVSLRSSLSADHNVWSGCLFVRVGRMNLKRFDARRFEFTRIVDRVGAGDAFAAGLIFGLCRYGVDFQKTLDLAVGVSALKHTVRGDAANFSEHQVQSFLKNTGGRIVR